MKPRWYWLTGIAFFLIGLIANLPASVLVNEQQQLLGTPVKLYGVSGSLWSGQARVAQVQRLRLNQLSWNVAPLWLLGATLAVDLQAQMGDDEQSAEVMLRPGGHIKAMNVVIDAPLATLGQQLGVKWLPMQAQLLAHFDVIKLHNNRLQAAQGQAQLHNSRWTLTRPAATLGDLSAQVSTDDEGLITASLGSSQSPLDLSGKATLNAEGDYQLDARVRALAKAGKPLRNLLQGMGKRQADGSHRLQLSGKLYPGN